MAVPKASEHAEQVALFRWAEFAAARWPELALLHAIPNGGYRNRVTAALLKAEGVRRGVPDICLPVARCGWHGLYIELKAAAGRASREQRLWLAALRRQGYRAELCRGWTQARAVIEAYLKASGARPPETALRMGFEAGRAAARAMGNQQCTPTGAEAGRRRPG